MFYSLEGKISYKKTSFAALNVGGMHLKFFASPKTLSTLPDPGNSAKIFVEMYWRRDDGPELYGFISESELEMFEKLLSVSGVGPKSALSVVGLATPDQIVSAINEGKTELLTRVSGIGKKTAERIVLELKGKLALVTSPQTLTLMESDLELEDTLMSLGYNKKDAKSAIAKINPSVKGFKERLKAALRKSDR